MLTINDYQKNKAKHALTLMLILMGSVWLSGCVVGPDYKKPNLSLPRFWSQNKSTAIDQNNSLSKHQLQNWWKNLNDPMLNQLVETAIQGNNDVAIAKAKIREARANLIATAAPLFPNLDSSFSYNHSRANLGPEMNLYRGNFDSKWEIDLFGANRRAIEASKYNLDASVEQLNATLVTLIGDLASYYVEVRSLQAKLQLTRNTALAQQRTAQLTRDKFSAGAVSQLDVANAQGQADSTAANIFQLQAQLAASIHRISILTGKPPATLTNLLSIKRNIPQPRFPIVSGIPADILLNRPDVRQAERQYAMSTARIGQKEAARYPSFTLTGTITTSASQFGDLAKRSTLNWGFGPGFTLPLFDAGQRIADVKVAQAQRDQAFITYRAKIFTALEEVENALVNLNSDRQRAVKLAAAERSYNQSLQLSRSLYLSGNTSFLDLLTSERSHYAAQQAYIDVRASITKDYISLMKALGGGWDGQLDIERREIIDTNMAPHFPKN